MGRLGCLLMIIGMATLMVLVVLPVLPFTETDTNIDRLLGGFLCPDGQFVRDLYQTSYRPGSTTFSMEVFCQQGEERTDITGNWILLSLVGFTVPFLLGLFLFISGVSRSATRSLKSVSTGMTTIFTEKGQGRTIQLDWIAPQMPYTQNQATLAERLKQLEDARSQGLISEEEYEQIRKDILQDGV